MDTMGHGELILNSSICKPLPSDVSARTYYNNVFSDYLKLKKLYPFSKLFILPTIIPYEAKIIVVAVEKDLIDAVHAVPEDFTEDYSKLIEVVVPYNYRQSGCNVYGGKWIDLDKLKLEEQHYNERLKDGRLKLCIGVPVSFAEMENVILECVRTADNYLVAYEKYQKGQSKTLELISYSHGSAGIKQYEKDKKRYRTKG